MADHQETFGLYIHWPFCKKKCPYCDFNSHVNADIDQSHWQEALLTELRSYAETMAGRRMHSIFFGGGTPSLMKPELVKNLIEEAFKLWPETPRDIEITLEANPTSSEAGNFQGYRLGGVNRLSIGVQSFRNDDLKFLGREHSVSEAQAAIKLATALFPRFSFDLIYGRPEQTLDDWRAELDEALAYAVGHISLYQLTIEPGTQFYTRFNRGDFQMPDDNLGSAFYTMTKKHLEARGFGHYEISNFAKPDQQSRHNLGYWQYEDYIGIGPGAHSRFLRNGQKIAAETHKNSARWLDLVASQGHGLKKCEVIAPQDQLMEALMMGLRLKNGIALKRLDRIGEAFVRAMLKTPHWQALIESEDLIITDSHIIPTWQGRQRLNAVLSYLFDGMAERAA